VPLEGQPWCGLTAIPRYILLGSFGFMDMMVYRLFHDKKGASGPNVYSFNSYHMWLTCCNQFGNVLYSVLTQENALYT